MKKGLTVLMVMMMTASAIAGEARFFNFELVAQTESEQPTSIKINIPVKAVGAFDQQIDRFLLETNATEEFNTFTEVWREIKNVGPHDYVEINHGDDTVFVSTTETDVIVDINSREEGKIKITIPMDLVDYVAQIRNHDDFMEVVNNMEGRVLLRIEGDRVNGKLSIQ